jgi:hypothetical protein
MEVVVMMEVMDEAAAGGLGDRQDREYEWRMGRILNGDGEKISDL